MQEPAGTKTRVERTKRIPPIDNAAMRWRTCHGVGITFLASGGLAFLQVPAVRGLVGASPFQGCSACGIGSCTCQVFRLTDLASNLLALLAPGRSVAPLPGASIRVTPLPSVVAVNRRPGLLWS